MKSSVDHDSSSAVMHSNDHRLKQAVEHEMDWADDVNNEAVGIAVIDGAVMLSGEVSSYREKAAAVSAALRIRGVTALVDDIVVRHTHGLPEDADIARAASAALNTMTLLQGQPIHATVHDHAVTLTGAVNRHHQRTAAVQAVGELAGVRAVHDLIELRPLEPMIPTEDAKANVIAALERNAQLEARDVEVLVSGTQIKLIGHVATWSARHQAEFAAWCTPGVTHVDDQLRIVG